MNAMRQDGFSGQQAVGIVDMGIRVIGWVQSADESDLGCVFAEMGLDWEITFSSERTEAREQL